MDIDMDVDFDAGGSNNVAGAQQPVQEPTQAPADAPMPAAYYENLDSSRPLDPWPEYLNLQGVSAFDPNDPLYYAMEHCLEPRVKQTRWINDASVNLQYYSASDAALALAALTDPSAGDPSSIPPETGRRAKPFSKQPDAMLVVRQANAGDQKARGAANRSQFYKQNPDVRGGDRGGDRRENREPRRRPPPQREYLDYDEEPRARKRRSLSGDERMRDDSDFDARRNRRNGNRERGGGGGRFNEREGRLRSDVDSYRPGSRSPREPRFGRLRGRSASPTSSIDGDGRYGFPEDGSSSRRAYRSRSRSRSRPSASRQQRRRDPSSERWTHDRAGFSDRSGKWARESSIPRPATQHGTRYTTADPFASTSNHRRSDALDETGKGGGSSLLSRMTKDGQPLAASASGSRGRSLASRITRDDDPPDLDGDGDRNGGAAKHWGTFNNGRSRARHHGDDDASYGRLKDDFSEVRAVDFSEEGDRERRGNGRSRPGLASRMTIDGAGDDEEAMEGINVRGTAATAGLKIRGVAGGS